MYQIRKQQKPLNNNSKYQSKNSSYPASRRVHAHSAEQPPCIAHTRQLLRSISPNTLQAPPSAAAVKEPQQAGKQLGLPSVSAISNASLDSFREPPVTCRLTKTRKARN